MQHRVRECLRVDRDLYFPLWRRRLPKFANSWLQERCCKWFQKKTREFTGVFSPWWTTSSPSYCLKSFHCSTKAATMQNIWPADRIQHASAADWLLCWLRQTHRWQCIGRFQQNLKDKNSHQTVKHERWMWCSHRKQATHNYHATTHKQGHQNSDFVSESDKSLECRNKQIANRS